jgi:pimeloyl-ACP methyl ester carboxylesterase
MRLRRLCAAVSLTSLVLAPTPAKAVETSCRNVYTPVHFGLTQQTMYGRLCVPQGATKVQVLVPGATYTSDYWDIPVNPDARSVTRAMNNAGIATMTVDRIGTGKSSKPLSVLVNAVTQAEAVHDVIRTLRPQFDKVLIGGHSLGSAISMVEAGTYHDVDGVLVTGMTHMIDYARAVPAIANSIPATLDPKLSARGLDAGYLTTMPGARYGMFHAPGPNVPDAVNHDESTKDVFAAAEAINALTMNTVVLPASSTITAPVMTAQSSADYFCGIPPLGADCSSTEALVASERPYFPQAPRVDGFLLDGYGHCFNYAPDSAEYHAAIIAWQQSI